MSTCKAVKVVLLLAFGVAINYMVFANNSSHVSGVNKTNPLINESPVFNAPEIKTIPEMQGLFIEKINNLAEQVNKDILIDRHHLEVLYQQFQVNQEVYPSSKEWLDSLAKYYRVKNPDFHDRDSWEQLLSRVDSIPPSLVIAQAINESNWGRSRFAVQANNYFGQHCNTPGCGIMPKARAANAVFEVTKFESPYNSVSSYIRNLNTNSHYQQLRLLRSEQRENHLPVNGASLAAGLAPYSTTKTYIARVKKIIHDYGLGGFDSFPGRG